MRTRGGVPDRETVPGPAWPSAQLRRVKLAYGAADHPRREFVRAAVSANPYRSLVSELAATLPVVDDTDINDDSCFVYLLRRGPTALILRLSMVGPYALVAADVPDVGVTLLESADAQGDDAVRVQNLARHHLTVPPRDALLAPVAVDLPDVADVRTYNVLFSPEEEVPGWLRG